MIESKNSLETFQEESAGMTFSKYVGTHPMFYSHITDKHEIEKLG